MAEHSYFWTDSNGDREYNDEDLAEYSGGFVTHGVYNGDLAVSPGENMNIVIPVGRAYVGPLWKVRKYYNDGPLILAIDNADGVLHRKDTVVLRSDVNARSITAQVIKGTPASNPVAPAIVRDAEIYDLKIAEISIPAGTTAITGALITDTRLNSDVCGIVTGVIAQVDTTTFYNQIAADLASFKNVNEADLQTWFSSVQAELADFKATNESAFNTWFQGLQDVLDENTAANLLNLINNHKADLTSHISYGGTTAGTSTAYTLASPAITALTEGMAVSLKAHVASGVSPTLNWAGTGAKAIKNPDGTDMAAGDLAAGGVYTLRYDGSSFTLQGKGGINAGDKQALIDITNEAEANDSAIKADVATKLQAVSTDTDLGLSAASTWAEIQAAVPNAKTGKRWKSETLTVNVAAGASYTITGLNFIPKTILLACQIVIDAEAEQYGINQVVSTLIENAFSPEQKAFVSYSNGPSGTYPLVYPEPTSNQFTIVNHSSYVLNKIWYMAFEG